jgi:hypothetical protein
MRAFQQKKATKRGPFAMLGGPHRSNIGVVPLISLFIKPAKVKREDPVTFGFIEHMDRIYTHVKPLKMLSVNWGKHLNKEVAYL